MWASRSAGEAKHPHKSLIRASAAYNTNLAAFPSIDTKLHSCRWKQQAQRYLDINPYVCKRPCSVMRRCVNQETEIPQITRWHPLRPSNNRLQIKSVFKQIHNALIHTPVESPLGAGMAGLHGVRWGEIVPECVITSKRWFFSRSDQR